MCERKILSFSETVKSRKFVFGNDIGWGCSRAMSWFEHFELDLTFDLAIVTLSFKILSRLYLKNRKV